MSQYEQKVDDIKSRIQSTQEQNEVIYTMIERTKKMIKRARLERSLLLEKLEEVSRTAADSEGLSSSPPESVEAILEENSISKPRGLFTSKAASSKESGGGNRLPNAYSVFCKQEKERIIQELDSPKPSLVQSKLSEKWRSLSAEEKKRYSEQAKDLKAKEKASNSKEVEQQVKTEDLVVKDEVEENNNQVSAQDQTSG